MCVDSNYLFITDFSFTSPVKSKKCVTARPTRKWLPCAGDSYAIGGRDNNTVTYQDTIISTIATDLLGRVKSG